MVFILLYFIDCFYICLLIFFKFNISFFFLLEFIEIERGLVIKNFVFCLDIKLFFNSFIIVFCMKIFFCKVDLLLCEKFCCGKE